MNNNHIVAVRVAKPLPIKQEEWDKMCETERRQAVANFAKSVPTPKRDRDWSHIDPMKPDAVVYYFGEHACIELRGTKVAYTHLDRMLGENVTEDISDTALGLILIMHGGDRG